MGDVNLEIDLDQQGLRQSVRRAERTLQNMERRLSRRRARVRLNRIRADRQTEQRISRDREREERNRIRMERRLSRRRARARLRQMRASRRAEARIEREAERERERRRDRRRRIARGAVGVAGRGASVVGGGAIGAVGALFDSEQVLEFGRSLAVLSGQAGITRKEQAKLAESITNVSIQTGTARTEVLRGFQAIIEKSGNLKLASGVLLDMSKASVGLGADMEDLGTLAAALGESFGASGKDVVKFFELLAAQGDKGQVSLENLADIGADVFSKAAAFGVKGEAGVSGVGAILQTIPLASIDDRKTAIGNLLELFGTSGDKIKKTFGVSTKGAGGSLRNPAEILKDIVRSTGGDLSKIKKVFTGPALAPFLQTAGQFKDTKKSTGTGRFDKLDEFLSLGAGSKGLIQKRFTRVEDTASVIALEKLEGIITKLSDKALSPALTAFSESLEDILSQDLTQLVDGFQALGEVLGFLTKGAIGAVSGVGEVAKFFGFEPDKKNKLKQLVPSSSQKPVKQKQEEQGNVGNMKLNVTTNVAVDDRGNPKKSRTRVDTQNNANVGRTLGVLGR